MAARDPSSKNNKVEERSLFRKQETHALKETKGTTVFKEAWRKEQEFKLRQMQRPPPSSSSSASASSQELPPKPSLVGLKRKAVSPSFPQTLLEGCRNSHLPQPQPRRPPVVNAETRGAQLYRPSPLGPQYKKPPLQHSPRELKFVPNQTTFGQPSHSGQPYNQQSQPAGTSNDPSSCQMASLWCDLCKVPCMNEFNLREHNRGRKHKAKLESASGSKRGNRNGDQTVVCRECNVRCPNEMSLAQHRAGKNHTLRLVKLGMLKVKKETPGCFPE